MNTTENNILIAEFMKIVFHDDANQYYDSIVGVHIGYKLRYDYDWNWLMEVVNKCSQTAEDLNVESLFGAELWMFITADIESVYNSVITFIEWYNENSAKKEVKQA